MRSILVVAFTWLMAFAVHAQERASAESTWQMLEPYTQPPAEFAGKLGSYASPLLFADGSQVKTRTDWARRREEILNRWHRRLGQWPALVERPTVQRLE